MYDAFLVVHKLPYNKKDGLPPDSKDPVRMIAEMHQLPIVARVNKMKDFRKSVLEDFDSLKERFPEEYQEAVEWDPLVEFADDLRKAKEVEKKVAEESLDNLTTSTSGRSRRKRNAAPNTSESDCNVDKVKDSTQSVKRAKCSSKASTPARQPPVRISIGAFLYIFKLCYYRNVEEIKFLAIR
jgi:hypothetical protein